MHAGTGADEKLTLTVTPEQEQTRSAAEGLRDLAGTNLAALKLLKRALDTDGASIDAPVALAGAEADEARGKKKKKKKKADGLS